VVLLPGLVNAHTHLELSWMAGLVPPAPSMDQWITSMMRLRRDGPAQGPDAGARAVIGAIDALRASGTALVGDITNGLDTVAPLRASRLAAVTFHEILGFVPQDVPSRVREARARLAEAIGDQPGTVVGHAPYSTSPELLGEIARAHEGPAPLAIHLAESNEEMEFLRSGGGPIRAMLERLEVWHPAWRPPGGHPVEYLKSTGYLKPGTLIVHGVHLRDEDLEQARDARAVLVTCPRSNVWVGGGVPPLARFYAAGVDVAVGTDSLASVDSLSVLDELAAMRRIAPEVAAARLLDSATRVGAQALGQGARFGRLAPGYAPAMAAVVVPPALTDAEDVEEYLVSGVPSSDVSLIDLTTP
jgi:cytosine/adenosine deaminase-related metal-dependent hydrolase